MRRLPKCFEQGSQRRFGRARTLGMAAHAIDDHQQHGVISGGNSNPVLIFFAMADEADIRGLDLQCLLPGF
jgi:hypothetical protein